MVKERWDVDLKVLNGPLASRGEQRLQGPVIRIGSNPGPGGFRLHGYRGVDARQAVISAYEGSEVSVAPVGTNQVRVAPHPNVKWKEIDPITRPTFLSRNCALHLGPVGRGATLQFLGAQRVGVWTQGQLGSEAQIVQSREVGDDRQVLQPRQQPDAIQVQRRRVLRLTAATMPIWFLGCSGMMTVTAASILIAVILFQRQETVDIGVKEEGEDAYYYVAVDQERLERLPAGVKSGIGAGFYRWVMEPNARVARQGRLVQPDNWDQVFYDHVKMAVVKHSEAGAFWRTLDDVREEYATVVGALREAELPEVFAAIPYRESRYKAEAQSVVCAKGYWQFMPEMAHRLEVVNGLDLTVSGCRFAGTDIDEWAPTALATPPNVAERGEYMRSGVCRIPEIGGCAVDDRTDLELSTEAAMFALREAWEDDVLRASGAAVQITIASHNAGYADGRFKRYKSTNLLPAFKRWSKVQDPEEHPYFYGANLLCPTDLGNPDDLYCGSVLHPQTQHYVYPIVATHILAACYYGKNYDEAYPEFKAYRELVQSGYCSDLQVPDTEEARR